MKQYLSFAAFVVTVFFLSGCAKGAVLESGNHAPVNLSGWIVSWDKEKGFSEYRQLKHRLSGISCFMAYYDGNDKLFIPRETAEIAEFARKEGQENCYLTITNDRQDENSRNYLKDKELLKRIFKDDKHKDEAIGDMIYAAKMLACTGIELDYEGVAKDKEVLQEFLAFTYKLAKKCIDEGLSLRIVLEPGMPMDAGFCKGPEYVVMMYNLHGKHNGPGPKADAGFIKKTIDKMAVLPGKKSVAFAAGGCLWEDYNLIGERNGKIRFIDEDEAADLVKKHGVSPVRDAESAVLYCKYEDNGHSYELWYADSETLNAWIKAAADADISSVSIWHLGGNTDIKSVKRE